VAGIIPTGSRGPLISLIVTLSMWFMIQSKKSGFRVLATIASGAALTISMLLFFGDRLDTVVNTYFSRGQSVGLLEESGRPQLFNRAMLDFYSSPVVGVGLGAFGASSTRNSQGYSGKLSKQGSYPHNIVMELLSELGVIGLILFAIVLRPGKWLLGIRNPYFYLFLLMFLFSMSSGDINANVGVIIFGTLARLTFKYPVMNESPILPASPAMEIVK
jgi:O-antigen ligase